MILGVFAFLLALGGAGWLLVRLARQNRADGGSAPSEQQKNNEIAIKAILWLLICAGLFAAKLWPLAFMVLLAAGGVTAIEFWKQRQIDSIEGFPPADRSAHNSARMTPEEALQVLGIEPGSDAPSIRAAHRQLISQLHPDKGGSGYLAAKINTARDILLERITLSEKK